ncbi:MAG: PQQ-binding-like beta-propeller repeat protein, partial [Candidatus Coatesbacteria bacterium]|nr:PQQ-binding-like beta-propeller repeat protein [Candidatus Coatesbacteria bacterium]
MRIFIMILVGFSLVWGENYWDNFRGNYRQDGLSPLKGPTKPVFLGEIDIIPPSFNKSSERKIDSEKIEYNWPSSAGVISEDSTLYAHTTSSSNYLVAVKNAQLLWREEFTGEYEQQEMCIDEKGLLYFETGNGLICFDPKERIILWERGLDTPCYSIIFIPGGSNIYVMTGSYSDNGILYAINKDNGARTWSYNLGENNYRTMAIGIENGYYYAKYNNDKLTVFYPPNAFRYGCSPYPTPPSIDRNGVIYSVASDTLYAYNPGLYL